MHSTTRPREIDDPHDAPAIAPDVVPVTWADRVLADITRDAKTIQPDRQPHAAAPAPAVDTTFRAAAIPRPSRAKWVASATMAFLFALGSAFAAAGWQHYGDRAKEVIAEWTPIISTPFTLASSRPGEQAVPVEQAAAPADQAAAADQAQATAIAAQPADAAVPAAAPGQPSESAELIQSMARDLAAMGQQIEQLKTSIAELKANQQPTPTVARTTEAKPAELKPPAPAAMARPKVSTALPPPPPRPAPPPVRRPPPVQAGVAAPMQLAYPPPPPPPAPAQATARPDEDPVVRPPMPLRWGGAND